MEKFTQPQVGSKLREDLFPTALSYIKQADQFLDTPNQKESKVDIYLAYGEIFQSQNNYEKAADFFNKALDTSRSTNLMKNIIRSLCALSNHFVLQKELNKAFDHINEALSLIDKETEPSLKLASIINSVRYLLRNKNIQASLNLASKPWKSVKLSAK